MKLKSLILRLLGFSEVFDFFSHMANLFEESDLSDFRRFGFFIRFLA